MITTSNSLFRERDAQSYGRRLTSRHGSVRAFPRSNRIQPTANIANCFATMPRPEICRVNAPSRVSAVTCECKTRHSLLLLEQQGYSRSSAQAQILLISRFSQIYLDAGHALKEQILAKINPLKGIAGRYQLGDALLTYLKGL
jgi:hypothetical protein